MQRSRFPAVLVLTLASTFATAEVYKWVDAHGNVHYGDRPPAAGVDARSMPLPPAPAEDADHERRSLKQRRLLEAFEAERAERDRAETEAAVARAARAQKCESARRQLARFERANIVYTTDESGARAYMSDGERREAAANARVWIGKHCD
jgi:hypothetical protein